LDRIYLKTFGCRVNQSETEGLRRELLALRLAEPVGRFEDADLCVLNTCTVTREADKDALQLLRRIARRNPGARVIVTGCLATRAREEVLEACPGATVIGNGDKQSIIQLLKETTKGSLMKQPAAFGGRVRASIKIQDGCRQGCSYCIVPTVRPELRSKPLAEVEREFRGLLGEGFREIVLCGIRLGSWREGDAGFAALLGRLLDLPGDFRVRLSSLEITDVDDPFLELVERAGDRLCPSLHLPLQSGSDEVLRRMRRWYGAGEYVRRLSRLKALRPDGGFFSDILVGFPGETSRDFEDTLRAVREARLDGLHVFRYSARAGTDAAGYPGRIGGTELLARAERMRALDRELRRDFAARAVGSRRRVLVETPTTGMTDHFLRVTLDRDPGPGLRWVKITRAEGTQAWANCD